MSTWQICPGCIKRPELLFLVGKLQLCFFHSYGLSHSNFSLQVGILGLTPASAQVSPSGAIGHMCPIGGSSHAKIDTTPNKASPDTPIGIADAPPPGLSRMPRTAVRGAAVVEKCPPPRRRSPASGGAAPRPAEPWRRRHVLCMGSGHWKCFGP